MTSFPLKIVTPEGTYKEVDIDQLNIRTNAGQIGVLAHHMPLASGVEISMMTYLVDGKKEEFAVSGGFIYVSETEVTLILNAIERKDEIDVNRAKRAKERAERRLKEKQEGIDYRRAEVALQRAITRINVKGL
ncbi:MAG: F0F1 ATP synthase subunit epsilon [Thomasclavelia sp.]|jgi:F-type H+-transporting ATPase subunit epsilon|nr:F0F1 ATP synthase subunit epsilon [Thomasclavelia sp.]